MRTSGAIPINRTQKQVLLIKLFILVFERSTNGHLNVQAATSENEEQYNLSKTK